MGILEEFYSAIGENGLTRPVKLRHSNIHYARAAIEYHTGVNLSLEQTEDALYEAGLAPYKDYGIPRWYAKKHLLPRALSSAEIAARKAGTSNVGQVIEVSGST